MHFSKSLSVLTNTYLSKSTEALSAKYSSIKIKSTFPVIKSPLWLLNYYTWWYMMFFNTDALLRKQHFTAVAGWGGASFDYLMQSGSFQPRVRHHHKVHLISGREMIIRVEKYWITTYCNTNLSSFSYLIFAVLCDSFHRHQHTWMM